MEHKNQESNIMNILGIAAPFGHDSSAALLVNGKVVAAVEEERFTRKKHADGQMPINAIKYCLKTAGLTPEDIDVIAFPWSINPLKERRWEHFFKTFLTRPSSAYKKLTRKNKESGCVVPLYGQKSKCIINIVPHESAGESIQIDKKCLKSRD